LAGSDQAIVTAKDAAGAAVSPDIRRNRIGRVKAPISSERRRIEEQKAPGCGVWLGAGSCQPPKPLLLPDRGVDELALQ